jgi:DNA repair exonuclease SbcCD ATPase subunit
VRREGIMNLTQTVLAESFQQIIIISHVEDLEEYIDNIIEVEEGRMTAL